MASTKTGARKSSLRTRVGKLQKQLDALMAEAEALEKATAKGKGKARMGKAKGSASKLAKLFDEKGKTRYGNARYVGTVSDLPPETPVRVTVSRTGAIFATIPWGTKMWVKNGELVLA